MDKEWHAKHPLARDADQEVRLRWHRLHAAACGCRDVPPAIRSMLRGRRAA
jgi:hypothetical protein